MSRLSFYSQGGQPRFGFNNSGSVNSNSARQHQLQQLGLTVAHESNSMSLIGSSASSSLAMDLQGYDQAIQDLTESLNEVKLTAALALQESQMVREQMQQGILSVLSELTTMWCPDYCQPHEDFAGVTSANLEMPAPSDSTVAIPTMGSGGDSGSGGNGSTGGGAEDQRTNFRYKTQLCKNFMAGGLGRCGKGDTCQYAHGRQELRRICEHPRYKTKMCSLQISLGVCPHGVSCFFAHHPAELRTKDF